jgi:hypothetical protein
VAVQPEGNQPEHGEAAMTRWLVLAILTAAGFAPLTHAQQPWVPFVSFERDFRVLMPSRPERSVTREGSTQYRAESGVLEYFVLRHDPRRLADVQSPREDVIKRLGGSDSVRGLPGDDGDFGSHEFILRSGGLHSMHHIFTEGGQYYELVVRMRAEDVTLDRELAREYFASFQMARGAAFIGRRPPSTPESCNTRSNSIARSICQYVACLSAANAGHPVCASQPPFLR